MKRVIIESPYAGDIERNTEYARRCIKDSLDRGEAPLASHLLYPQVLDENDPAQRKQGIDAGLVWSRQADLAAFYCDYGRSPGMDFAWDRYFDLNLKFSNTHDPAFQFEERFIGKNVGDE